MEASEQAGLLEQTAIEYVVQVGVEDPDGVLWRDIASVAVAPRTKRKTVVEKALAEAAQDPGSMPLRIRVLSPEDARPFKVSAVARDPELRIEGA